jgi:hypothetical protein
MTNILMSVLWCVSLILVHEIGHYIMAKREGIYLGWGLLPMPHIEMSKPHKKPIKYFAGIALSLITFPLYFLSFSELPLIYLLLTFFVTAILTGIFDIFAAVGVYSWKE